MEQSTDLNYDTVRKTTFRCIEELSEKYKEKNLRNLMEKLIDDGYKGVHIIRDVEGEYGYYFKDDCPKTSNWRGTYLSWTSIFSWYSDLITV